MYLGEGEVVGVSQRGVEEVRMSQGGGSVPGRSSKVYTCLRDEQDRLEGYQGRGGVVGVFQGGVGEVRMS